MYQSAEHFKIVSTQTWVGGWGVVVVVGGFVDTPKLDIRAVQVCATQKLPFSSLGRS